MRVRWAAEGGSGTGRLASRLAVAAFLGACSSATAPGSDSALDALDEATKAQIDVVLVDAVRAQQAYNARAGSYTADVNALDMTLPEEVRLTIPRADASGFCVQVTHSELEGVWHATLENPAAIEGAC